MHCNLLVASKKQSFHEDINNMPVIIDINEIAESNSMIDKKGKNNSVFVLITIIYDRDFRIMVHLTTTN